MTIDNQQNQVTIHPSLGESLGGLKQHKLDERYLRMARIWAENSYCQRRQVGALVVKNKMIISDGYNGTPTGFENVCEDEAGIRRVVYGEKYRLSDGIELLERAGIEVVYLEV